MNQIGFTMSASERRNEGSIGPLEESSRWVNIALSDVNPIGSKSLSVLLVTKGSALGSVRVAPTDAPCACPCSVHRFL